MTARRHLLHALALPLLAPWLAGSARAQPATPAAADPRLLAALTGTHRSVANRARDAARHPAETLQFFGVQAGQSVIELAPGGGWYTEILAPWLRGQGMLYAAHYARDDPSEGRRKARASFQAKLDREPELYSQVVVGSLPSLAGGPRFTDISVPGGADAVLTFRNVHNWLEDKQLDLILQASLAVLKPGGVLGVVDHRAAPGTPLAQMMASGYVTEALMTERALAAGFVAAGRSEVNANPRDARDHAEGVWALPPTLRGVAESDRPRMLAIGESDRFTHRYVKPAS